MHILETHAILGGENPTRPHTYIKNYRQLSIVMSQRGASPQGREQQLVIRCHMVKNANMHIGNIIKLNELYSRMYMHMP